MRASLRTFKKTPTFSILRSSLGFRAIQSILPVAGYRAFTNDVSAFPAGELPAKETQAYVFPSAGTPAELQTITLPPMTATQVEVDMRYNGLCHTDIHMRDNDWGISNYPMVAGHEGGGIVTHVGSAVKNIKVGDQVGITWIRDSCRTCSPCRQGRENICQSGYQGVFLSSAAGPWGKTPYNEHGGCFSKTVRIEENWAIKIPETLPLDVATPYMCGGGTVFEPIVDYVDSTTRVGVVGMGGLGTAAIKFAKLFGAASITALSRSPAKEAGIRKIGATHFVNTTSEEEMTAAAGSLDFIIDTTPTNYDISPFMGLLAFNGGYCRVGIPGAADHDVKGLAWIPTIFTQKKVIGSIVTGTARANRMVDMINTNQDYIVNDDPHWKVQRVPFSQVNQAMADLAAGKNEGWRIMLVWD